MTSSGIQLNFSESISLVLQLYDYYEKKGKETEHITNQCRSLFKPWPKKVPISRSCSQPGSSTVVENHEEGTKKTREEDSISQREEAELALLDDLLLKAQKTRDAQLAPSDKKKAKSSASAAASAKQGISGKNANSTLKSRNKENEKTSSSKKTSANPSSRQHVSKSAETKVKYVPTHSTAPFKTDPNMHKKRTVVRPQFPNHSKANKTGNKLISKPTQHSTELSKHSSETPHSLTVTCAKETFDGGEHVPISNSCGDSETAVSDIQGTKSDCDSRVTSQPRLQEAEKKCEQDGEFLLSRDGADLSLPGKLKKLLHTHQKLKDKLSTLHPACDTDATGPAKKFLNKFEQAFSASNNRCVQLHRGIIDLEKEYRSASRLMDQIPLESLSDDSSAENVLRSKLVLAEVLSRFYSMEEEYQLIEKDLRAAKSKKQISSVPTVTVENFLEKARKKDIAFSFHTFQDVMSGRREYRSSKKLTDFVTMCGQHDFLQVEKIMSERAGEEILDYLNSSNCENCNFFETYRSGYTLLCSSGRFFPTMVRDLISSEDSDD